MRLIIPVKAMDYYGRHKTWYLGPAYYRPEVQMIYLAPLGINKMIQWCRRLWVKLQTPPEIDIDRNRLYEAGRKDGIREQKQVINAMYKSFYPDATPLYPEAENKGEI